MGCQSTPGPPKTDQSRQPKITKQTTTTMKKQIAKLSVKTDKIVSLSKQDAQQVIGALAPPATLFCPYIKTKIFC
ncbi:hypothetical protein BN8_00070 [Fibrisoma limi BUZ 3]|uniref:Uncharacterized protein n=1 Tax=Fibrisoma limi BUZ 3 TaxID=1185876 RepID=I2GB83_9BACT|nr:hypothetical protein BN8_00070 [Fibrisoma limi BUZ 3]